MTVPSSLLLELSRLVDVLQATMVTAALAATSTPITTSPQLIEPHATIAEVVSPIDLPDFDTKTREVPFYSQFNDISDPSWKKVGCGIAGLAMLIDYYKPAVSVDTLLREGIASGAYLSNAGWIHAGLIGVAKHYGLSGSSNDLSGLTMDVAFEELRRVVDEGPVMASVYYTFTPGHPIPHLVVINSIEGDTVYYNDPAEPSGGGSIAIEDFKPAWKKRYIEIRPIESM